MKTVKIWRKSRLSESHANPCANGRPRAIYAIAFGLWPSHLTLGKAMQASLSSCLIGVLTMLAVFSLASCSDDPDGKWESMVWKAEVPVQTINGVYNVSATGNEFPFSCQNYSSPWIENAVSNGVYYYPPREANDYHTITADWFRAEISGNKLKVVFEANETPEERPLQLTITAGDIFHTFKFMQSASK